MAPRAIDRFLHRADGAITQFGLFLIIAMICVGGLGLDVMNAMRVKTHLQVAADAAAHAALMARDAGKTEDEAKALAVQIAQGTAPERKFGRTLEPGDIRFGTWDEATREFTEVANSRDAVLVAPSRRASKGNAVSTYFLRFAGLETFDVVSPSVFESYLPSCFREGFVGQGRVDIQSNNRYRAGFCIHSNTHVELNTNNVFENEVIVSMPDKATAGMPAGGYEKNPGLADALRSGAFRLRILYELDPIILTYDDPNSDYWRDDYLDKPVDSETLSTATSLDEAVWEKGKIHRFDCSASGGGGGGSDPTGGGQGNGKKKDGTLGGGGGNKTVKIPANTRLVGGVIDTDCLISIGSGVVLEDVLIVSRNTDIKAVSGAAGVTLGKDDKCADGGGVQIVTKGGVHFPSNLSLYGAQIIAAKKIDFEANAHGVEGVSMVSGGEIDGTSNMDMGFCGGEGMSNNFEATYFRMAH